MSHSIRVQICSIVQNERDVFLSCHETNSNEWMFLFWEHPLIAIFTHAYKDYMLCVRLNLLPG